MSQSELEALDEILKLHEVIYAHDGFMRHGWNPKIREALIQWRTDSTEEALKRGFYAGQAMAGVELDDCHKNWKEWGLCPYCKEPYPRYGEHVCDVPQMEKRLG